MKMLQHKTMYVFEIRRTLGITQPSASKHLKLLENAGLVNHEKNGSWVNYSLTDGGSSPYAANRHGEPQVLAERGILR